MTFKHWVPGCSCCGCERSIDLALSTWTGGLWRFPAPMPATGQWTARPRNKAVVGCDSAGAGGYRIETTGIGSANNPGIRVEAYDRSDGSLAASFEAYSPEQWTGYSEPDTVFGPLTLHAEGPTEIGVYVGVSTLPPGWQSSQHYTEQLFCFTLSRDGDHWGLDDPSYGQSNRPTGLMLYGSTASDNRDASAEPPNACNICGFWNFDFPGQPQPQSCHGKTLTVTISEIPDTYTWNNPFGPNWAFRDMAQNNGTWVFPPGSPECLRENLITTIAWERAIAGGTGYVPFSYPIFNAAWLEGAASPPYPAGNFQATLNYPVPAGLRPLQSSFFGANKLVQQSLCTWGKPPDASPGGQDFAVVQLAPPPDPPTVPVPFPLLLARINVQWS